MTLEEQYNASKRLEHLTEQLKVKQKAVSKGLQDILALYESANVDFDGFLQKLVKQRELHMKRLKEIEEGTRLMLDNKEIEELEMRLMNALLAKLQEKR